MKYYIQKNDDKDEGPFSLEELEQRFIQRKIHLETTLYTSPHEKRTTYKQIKERQSASSKFDSQCLNLPRRPLKIWFFLWPFNQLRRLGDIDNRGLLSLIGVGLVPMILLTLFLGAVSRTVVFFLTALYFSVLWAILFYHVFPAPKIRISTSIYCFLGTGLVSVSLLVGFFQLPFITLPHQWLEADLPAIRALSFLGWVAFPEELCKVLMIYVLSKRTENYPPKTIAYYGMICGLGFGIYEGLNYQLDRNEQLAESQDEYLFLNLLRLTSLPVLHAVWTGTASYFLGFTFLYANRRWLLRLVGLGVPSVLHALFNTFNGTMTSLGISLLSVLMLILYLSKHDAFETFLRQEMQRQ